MVIKKKFLVFASAVLILTLLLGCTPSVVPNGGVSTPDETSKPSDVSNEVEEMLSAQQWMDMLEPYDYDGYNFTVATTKDKVFLVDEDASSVIDEAKDLRNEMVESKFNINIVEKLYGAEELLPEQSIAALVNTAIADVVCAPAEQMSVLADNGLMLNLYSVPYLDLDAKYISDKLLCQYTAENTAYMMFDDVIPYQTNLWAVFYNNDIIKSFGVDDPYSHVKNGTWTWDLMLEMAKTVAPDELEDESGAEEQAEDESTFDESIGEAPTVRYYGLASYYNEKEDLDLAYAMLSSMDGRFFGETYQKQMSLSLDLGVATKAMDTFLGLFESKMHFDGDGNAAITEFSEGRLLFYVYETSLAAALANSKSDWGIAPLPKFSAEQEQYNSWLDLSAVALGVFNTNENTPRVGRILNGLCAASYGHIAEATEMAYLNYYLRNNQSSLSLKNYVFANPFVDVTFLYASGIEDLRTLTLEHYNEAILEGVNFEKKLFDEENKALADELVSIKFK